MAQIHAITAMVDPDINQSNKYPLSTGRMGNHRVTTSGSIKAINVARNRRMRDCRIRKVCNVKMITITTIGILNAISPLK